MDRKTIAKANEIMETIEYHEKILEKVRTVEEHLLQEQKDPNCDVHAEVLVKADYKIHGQGRYVADFVLKEDIIRPLIETIRTKHKSSKDALEKELAELK